jgi:hypothetical protein
VLYERVGAGDSLSDSSDATGGRAAPRLRHSRPLASGPLPEVLLERCIRIQKHTRAHRAIVERLGVGCEICSLLVARPHAHEIQGLGRRGNDQHAAQLLRQSRPRRIVVTNNCQEPCGDSVAVFRMQGFQIASFNLGKLSKDENERI